MAIDLRPNERGEAASLAAEEAAVTSRSPRSGPRGAFERFFVPGSFARSVLTLMTGTTIANLIPVLLSPVLTRLYAPAEFGLFAVYGGIAALLAVLATGRYEMAIVLPAEDDDAFHLLGLSLLVVGLMIVVATVAVIAFHSPLLGILRSPGLSSWLYLLPLGVLLAGAIQALTVWLNRKRAYPRIAQSRILQALLTAAAALGLARRGLGAGGLILSSLAGQTLAAVVLSFAVWRSLRGAGRTWSLRHMRAQAARYKDFPRVNALHALMDNLSVSVAVIVLSHEFGSAVVGHYSMVMRVLTAPVALIGAAITQVFYQRAAEIHNRGDSLQGLIRSLLARSVWIALPGALVLLAFAPRLFPFVFGPNWATAGTYARLLSPYMFFYFLAAPLAFVPFVLNKQLPAFFLSTAGNLLFLACLVLGGRLGSPATGFTALSIAQSVYFVVYIGWMLRIAGRPKEIAA